MILFFGGNSGSRFLFFPPLSRMGLVLFLFPLLDAGLLYLHPLVLASPLFSVRGSRTEARRLFFPPYRTPSLLTCSQKRLRGRPSQLSRASTVPPLFPGEPLLRLSPVAPPFFCFFPQRRKFHRPFWCETGMVFFPSPDQNSFPLRKARNVFNSGTHHKEIDLPPLSLFGGEKASERPPSL